MTYISVSKSENNTYLLKQNSSFTLMKNNFSYTLGSQYNKIISVINDLNVIDTIIITESQKLPVKLNTNWGLIKEESNDSYTKNILIPDINHIDLINESLDINNINCICQDQTNIHNLPSIIINIDSKEFIVSKWTGYNQVWTSISSDIGYDIYSYLYFFQTKAIFMSSINQHNKEITHHNDLDIMSIYEYPNIVHDELNRINCNKLRVEFTDLNILNKPLNDNFNNVNIRTEYNDQ